MTDFDRLVAHFEGMDIAEAVGLSGSEVPITPPPPPVRPPSTRKRTLGESRRHGLLGRPVTKAAEEEPDEFETSADDTRIAALDSAVSELRDRPPPPDLENSHDLDELARRLYPYLRSRLRAELLVDRERAGRLADAR